MGKEMKKRNWVAGSIHLQDGAARVVSIQMTRFKGNCVEQGLQSHMPAGARQMILTGELGQVKRNEGEVT